MKASITTAETADGVLKATKPAMLITYTCPVTLSAEEWGWYKDDFKLEPHRTDLEDASKVGKELIFCKCHMNKCCRKPGRCKKSSLSFQNSVGVVTPTEVW